jgi:N-acyl-D-amino-acid deacylase
MTMKIPTQKTDSVSRREFIKKTTAAGISATVLGGVSLTQIGCVRAPIDLLIRGGAVLDGTGASEYRADIALKNGRIVAIGTLSDAQSERVINASGLKVTPGFIDIHSHVDTELFRAPRSESKLRQGVTTEVTGCDGESVAPMDDREYERSSKHFQESYGVPYPFKDMAGFFTFLEHQKHSQNMISLVGLGSLRQKNVGMDNRPATSDEMEAMKRDLLIAIEQGCYGTSTGLEYTPGSFASTQELWELVKIVPAQYRIYATHMRNEDNSVLEALDEAITIARNSGASLQVSHLKAQNKINWPKSAKAIEMLEKALNQGMNVHADRYPYIAFNTGVANLFPLWCRDGGNEKFIARLSDPSELAKIKPDVLRKVDGLSGWDSVLISSVPSDKNKVYQGKTLLQLSQQYNIDPFDFTVEMMKEEKGGVGMVGFGMDEPGTELILSWKNTMVASDAGSAAPWGPGSVSRPHPRSYGTFPRAIAHYQRERNIVTLPEMIRKMTSLPAQKLGLKDRGVLAEGKAADIVLFNYETIQDRATFLDPHQFPVGIPYVIVNGIPVIENGLNTGALPGRILRSA